jgi:hypothetical protein
MRHFALGIVTALLMIATLAASEGGFNVVWEMEMKRPEAQKAISDFIVQNCHLTVYPQQAGYSQTGSVYCSYATTPAEDEICRECLNTPDDAPKFCQSGRTTWDPRSDGLCYNRDEEYAEDAQ